MPTLFYRDPVSSNFLPVVGGGNDHGNLFGLTDPEGHPQYVKDTGDTITGDITLNANLLVSGSVSFSSLQLIKSMDANALAVRNIGDTEYAKLYVGLPTDPYVDAAVNVQYIINKGFRPIYASTSAPSGGTNGDVWLVYT